MNMHKKPMRGKPTMKPGSKDGMNKMMGKNKMKPMKAKKGS